MRKCIPVLVLFALIILYFIIETVFKSSYHFPHSTFAQRTKNFAIHTPVN